jgi:hypothetical protein
MIVAKPVLFLPSSFVHPPVCTLYHVLPCTIPCIVLLVLPLELASWPYILNIAVSTLKQAEEIAEEVKAILSLGICIVVKRNTLNKGTRAVAC